MADLTMVPGIRETALDDALLRRIPDASAPAPWSTRLRAILWFHRASDAALDALPPRLRSRRRLPLTVGAFVEYLDTPVGPYREVLASPVVLLRRGLPASHVPFIAVDSPASVHGGRVNWVLPKTLADFTWAGPSARGEGAGWAVTATARPRGPRLPFATVARDLQVDPALGEIVVPIRGRGVARAARVTVDSAGPTLPSWLLAGTHAGLVLDRARVRFGEAVQDGLTV